MYLVVVALTMFVLPLGSVLTEHVYRPEVAAIALIGKWFVFWSVGVRLSLAGLRQITQPVFTAREIFHIQGDEVLPIIKEFGCANLAIGVVGMAAVFVSTFVLPAAITGAVFYGAAGMRHTTDTARSRNQTIAMLTDIYIFLVLAVYVAATSINA